jgi:hypothetical protein
MILISMMTSTLYQDSGQYFGLIKHISAASVACSASTLDTTMNNFNARVLTIGGGEENNDDMFTTWSTLMCDDDGIDITDLDPDGLSYSYGCGL